MPQKQNFFNNKDIKMDNELSRLTKNIARIRAKKGLTREELAEMVNYSVKQISKLEAGRTNPSFDLIVKISTALDVEPRELFELGEKKENSRTILKNILELESGKNIRLLYKLYSSIDY